MEKNGKILIVGGGIIGCSTAFYLTQAGYCNVTILEAVGVAHAASGRAGGFLAMDWCDSSFTKDLARKSFQLHEELVKTLGKDIGYRKMNTLSMSVLDGTDKKSNKKNNKGCDQAPDWVDGNVQHCQEIGNTCTTAQVTPKLLCEALLDKAKEQGAQVKIGQVVGAEVNNNKVTSLKLKDGECVKCDAVLLSMGPWTGQGLAWFGKPNVVSGDRAHSVLLKPQLENSDTTSSHIDNTALFLHYRPNYAGKSQEPEVYPRPDGTVYVCGQGDNHPLPDQPAHVEHSSDSCHILVDIASKVSDKLASAKLIKESACYLPCSKDNIPLIGKVPGLDNLFIGTGHYCWGILQAPATGQALAQYIASDNMPDILVDFDPARLL